ncbi:MAG: hypothetical protein KatS3mg031_3033 [Chitinophagales bacterium]|nr:MAG: hypothetical protein KatS3mg031_3033 [Chitinophagales bacterium]
MKTMKYLHLFSVFCFALFFTSSYSQSLTWLGTLGGNASIANDVSDDGPVVVGYSYTPDVSKRAFSWSPTSGMVNLGALGGDESVANAVSADGSIIVGYLKLLNSSSRLSFRWTQTTGMVALQEFSQDVDGHEATAISDDGSVIAGIYFDNDSSNPQRAYIYTTQMTDMTSLNIYNGTTHQTPTDLSSSGAWMAGHLRDDPNNSSQRKAFRVDVNPGSQPDLLGTLGGNISVATAISSDGSVIVGYSTDANGEYRAFRWRNTTGMVALPSFGPSTFANDVSSTGRYIVGHYDLQNLPYEDDDRAILWDAFTVPATLRSLNDYYADLLQDGSILENATAISPNGRYIAGYGFNATTQRREAFLLDREGVTGLSGTAGLPGVFRLEQNAPNPFSTETIIRWQTPAYSHQLLKIYDMLGNEVATVVNTSREAGEYEAVFSASHLPGGVYFYRLQCGDYTAVNKMILMK